MPDTTEEQTAIHEILHLTVWQAMIVRDALLNYWRTARLNPRERTLLTNLIDQLEGAEEAIDD